MTNILLKTLSPQAASIYQLLVKNKAMTAKDIGKELSIFPHAVYRAVKPLIELGIVEELDTYPTRFEAIPIADALDLYSLTINQNFQEVFASRYRINSHKQLDISFIRSRDDLLEKTNEDIKISTNAVDFIVSGLELPAETMLVYKQAIDRGVKIRALVQCFDETSKQMFRNWKKMGIEVKYYPNMEARIFVIDKKIVYFTSYNQQYKEEAIGMRFGYTPYAKIMDELFEQRWKNAKRI